MPRRERPRPVEEVVLALVQQAPELAPGVNLKFSTWSLTRRTAVVEMRSVKWKSST
jgi:hypothetical protein